VENHPQLKRFKSSSNPAGAIASYLRRLHEEATRRGYRFNEEKIAPTDCPAEIPATRGQLLYEWQHLKEKLKARDPKKYGEIKSVEEPEAHPIFKLIEGDVEAWEIIKESI
jgi:hypothetical protein